MKFVASILTMLLLTIWVCHLMQVKLEKASAEDYPVEYPQTASNR